jgi:hypothetical protein
MEKSIVLLFTIFLSGILADTGPFRRITTHGGFGSSYAEIYLPGGADVKIGRSGDVIYTYLVIIFISYLFF